MRHFILFLTSIALFLLGFSACVAEVGKIGNVAGSPEMAALSFALMIAGVLNCLAFLVFFGIEFGKPKSEVVTKAYILIPICITIISFAIIFVPFYHKKYVASKNYKQMRLIENGTIDLKTLITSGKKLTPGQKWGIKSVLKKQSELPFETIEILSKINLEKKTLLALYNHPQTTIKIRRVVFEKLSKTDYDFGEIGPAQNPKLTPDELNNIANVYSDNLLILLDVLQNPKCPEKTITIAFEKYSSKIMTALITDLQSLPQKYFPYRKMHKLILSNPNTSSKIIDKLLAAVLKKSQSYPRESGYYINSLCTNPNLTDDQINQITNRILSLYEKEYYYDSPIILLLENNTLSHELEMMIFDSVAKNKDCSIISTLAKYTKNEKTHTKILKVFKEKKSNVAYCQGAKRRIIRILKDNSNF